MGVMRFDHPIHKYNTPSRPMGARSKRQMDDERAAFAFLTLDLNAPVMGLNNHFAVEKAYP